MTTPIRAALRGPLAALAKHRQFVVYRLTPSADRPGCTVKQPVDYRTGQLPPKGEGGAAIWTDASTACTAAERFGDGYGVGFSFADSDPFWFIDVDHCLQSDNTWSPLAVSICAMFAGAYIEVSQSGRGLHLIGSASGPIQPHGCKNGPLGLECYDRDRFVALTGRGATGDAASAHDVALAQIIAAYFPPSAGGASLEPSDEWTDLGTDPADDDALIARMLASRPSTAAIFGTKATAADLWHANAEALGRAYPDANGRPYDASRADAALAQYLAFYTGKDCERMRRLMLRSALRREKYERDDYLRRSILGAVARQVDVYAERATTAAAPGNWQIAPFADTVDPDLSHDALALDLSAAGWALDARYVAAWGRWLFWDGFRWQRDDSLRHMSAVRDFLRGKAMQLTAWAERKAAATPDPAEADKIRATAKRLARDIRQAPFRASVELTARSNLDLSATVEEFDADPDIVGAPSCTIDLRTGATRAPVRADMITRSLAVDPAAPGTPAPLWLSFLHRAFAGDQEMIAFLQRAAGYSLTGHTREQRLLFLFGTGANGKSVFLNTLQWLLAEYAKRAPAETFLDGRERHPTELAGLMGARLVVSSELPPGKSWNESVIKDLTGGDVISARFMRQDFFEYSPRFTLLICGNHMPTFRGVDEAIRRRVLLVPFTVTIPKEERDHTLPERLRAEGPAILRWCIEGAVDWYRQGLNPPASVEAASVDYLDGEDMLGEFLAECLPPTPGAAAPISAVYGRFQVWSTQRGLHSPWSQHALTRALGERGLTLKRKNDGRWLIDHQLQGWATTLTKGQ